MLCEIDLDLKKYIISRERYKLIYENLDKTVYGILLWGDSVLEKVSNAVT